jgi:hypothetical protein
MSSNTGPQLLLRRILWHRGHRYRLHSHGLAGRPDIVAPRARVAIFIDFGHGCNLGDAANKIGGWARLSIGLDQDWRLIREHLLRLVEAD